MTSELSKTTTQKIRTKLEDIKKRLSEMEDLKNAGPKTNGQFHWNGREGTDISVANSTGTINITKITNLVLLIQILGFLLTRKAEYEQAAKELGLDTIPVFKWSGYPFDAWKNDINSQINLITHSDEVSKLTKLRDELSKYVSEEDRVLALLEEIGE